MRSDTFGRMLGTVKHAAVSPHPARRYACGLLLFATIVAGCAVAGSGDEATACTEIGSPSGIGITVAPAMAHEADSEARLTVHWNQQRVVSTVALTPSTTASAAPCSGDGPDSSCSARLVPTGGKNGFADVPDLPTTPVQVAIAIAATDGEPLIDDALWITPQTTYPNGPDCPAGGSQGHVAVDATGNLREAQD